MECHEVAWLVMLCCSVACRCAVALLGVLFFSLSWHDVPHQSVVWHAVLYCGLVCHKVSFCGLSELWLCMACRAMKWHGLVVIWLDVLFCGLVWFVLVCCYGVAWWIGLVWRAMKWLGLAWHVVPFYGVPLWCGCGVN